MKQISAPVVSNSEVMPGMHLMWVAAQELATLCRPGQFLMVRANTGLDPLLRRPLSVHRIAKEYPTYLALLFSKVGRGTELLAHLRPGESLDILGPLGQGFEVHSGSKNLLLIGGGMGVAALVALADEAIEEGKSVTLLLGARNAALLYPHALLPPEVELVAATDDGSAGHHGPITDLVLRYLDWADQVFACGPDAMYHKLAEEVRRARSQKEVQVLLETSMACGFGVCYGCAVETRQGMKLVCKDGPRFELRDVF